MIIADDLTPNGLRHVLVHVTVERVFPPEANSDEDIRLLRAANHAIRRKEQGTTDSFLFIFLGDYKLEKVTEAVGAYGFPAATITIIDCDEIEDGVLQIDYEEQRGLIGDAVSDWLSREHPGALAKYADGYPFDLCWWSGVDCEQLTYEWPFNCDAYESSLPDTHRERAKTWLAILNHVACLSRIQDENPTLLGNDLATSWAATLCEWLHGFEAASGNGYNHFDPSDFVNCLGPSPFYLGFELARLSGDDLLWLCAENGGDLNELWGIALTHITEELRHDLRCGLSNFFGGDTGIFWALYSAIWPKMSTPMHEASNAKVNDLTYEDMAELDAPWQFVAYGWCEQADV